MRPTSAGEEVLGVLGGAAAVVVAVGHQPVGHPLPALRADGAPVAPLIQQQGGQVPLAAHQHGLGHGGQAVLHRQDGALRIAGRLLIAPVQSGQEGPYLGGPVPQNLVGGGDGGGAEVEERRPG